MLEDTDIKLTDSDVNQSANPDYASLGESSVDTSSLENDPMYQTMANANPYKNVKYQLGWWDKFGNAIGIRTAEDKFREEMDARAREYDAQLIANKQEQDYNSERAKVQRMREAGLNPDIQGIGNASEATEFNEPETSPEVPSGAENQQQFSNIVSTIGSIASGFIGGISSTVSTVMSLASGIKSLGLQDQELSVGELNLGSKINDTAKTLLVERSNLSEIDSYQNDSQLFQGMLSLAESVLPSIGKQRQYQIARNAVSAAHNPVIRAQMAKGESDYESSRFETAKLRSHPGYAKDTNEWASFLKPAAQFAYEVDYLKSKAELAYQKYLDAQKDPENRAELHKAKLDAELASQRFIYGSTQAKNELMKKWTNLVGVDKENSWINYLGVIFLANQSEVLGSTSAHQFAKDAISSITDFINPGKLIFGGRESGKKSKK